MADEDPKVEISIEASQKTGAIDASAKQLDDLKKSAEEAGEGAKKGSQGFDTMTQATDALNKKIGEFVGAAAIAAFFKEAVVESLKEAEALRTLKFAVESTGQSWDKARGSIEQFAAAQQASTRFDDTVTFEVLGKMQRATGDLAQAMSATALAQDIAAASGKDLAETTALVNGLLTGQERSVKLAQKEFSAYVGTADTTAGVLAQLEKGFVGAAQAEDSFTKNLNQSKNFLADFQQRVGDGIVPIFAALAQGVAFVAKGFEQLGVLAAGAAATLFTSFGSAAEAIKAVFTGNFSEISDIWRQTKDSLTVTAEETAAAIDEIESRYHAQSVQRIQDRVVLHAQASEEEVRKADEAEKKKVLDKKKAEEQTKKLEEERKQNFASTLQFIATLSNAKNKELRALGKAAALAMAYINTAEAITKALASTAPPFNFILAAAVGAAGAAQVANIAGVELAEGGVVPGSQSGTQATIGEKGKKEAVIPLTNPSALKDIGQAINQAGGLSGSGGGTTIINISIIAEVPRWDAIIEGLSEEAARGTPEIIRLARRLQDQAELNAGRAA